MKTIEELGVSPAPWKQGERARIKDSKHYVISFDKIVARGTYAEVKAGLWKGDRK